MRITRLTRSVRLASVIALAGCGSAAKTFLDLPEPGPEQEADERTQSPSQAQNLPVGLEFFESVEPAPIEAVEDRDSVLALLPRDSAGAIDWIAAVRLDVIRPRRGKPDETVQIGEVYAFGYDFFWKADDPSLDAWFPHSSHVEWSACGQCHPSIFPYRGEPVTMSAINEGEACGRCHGPVAFAVPVCERCHTNVEMPAGRIEPSVPPDMVIPRSEDNAGASRESFPESRFSHFVHRIRYRCSACHPDPFASRLGATRISMTEMQDGSACGSCHNGGAAFGVTECTRCHYRDSAGSG